MNARRNFLKLGALFVPAAIVEPRRVYSFLWATPVETREQWIARFREELERKITLGLNDAHKIPYDEGGFRLIGRIESIVIKGTISILRRYEWHRKRSDRK